jgi:rubrerythrin
MVSAQLKYTAWGWFWLTFIGASANPIRAVWRCRVCGDVVAETEDPEALKALRDR